MNQLHKLVDQIAMMGDSISTNATDVGIEIVRGEVINGEYVEVSLSSDDLTPVQAIAFLQGYKMCLANCEKK